MITEALAEEVITAENLRRVLPVVKGSRRPWGWDKLTADERYDYVCQLGGAITKAFWDVNLGEKSQERAFVEVFHILKNWAAAAEIERTPEIRKALMTAINEVKAGKILSPTHEEALGIIRRTKG